MGVELTILCDTVENAKALQLSVNKIFGVAVPIATAAEVRKGDLLSCAYIISGWNMPQLNKSEIELYLPRLKEIRYCAGDTSYFRENYDQLNIEIKEATLSNAQSVADFTLGLVLLANKGYFYSVRHYGVFSFLYWKRLRRKQQKWPSNNGSVIGIIGYGNVGRELSKRLGMIECQQVIYDKVKQDLTDTKNIEQAESLDSIFSRCDVIINCLPDIMTTKKLISYNLLNKMKSNTTFINIGRGAQVDELALARVLFKCPGVTALLDVLSREPKAPWSIFNILPNAVTSPHIAGSTSNEVNRMVVSTLEGWIESKV